MDEAPVVVTAATGALGPVVEKLSTMRRRRRGYQLRCRTRMDLKVIRSKLKSIHSILWVIWETEDLVTEGKELRMEAWSLADDMNDAIDDFILSMKRSSDGRRSVEDKTHPRPFRDLKKRADYVWKRCHKKWKLETSLATRKTNVGDSGSGKRPRVVDPYVHKDISELKVMELPRDKLVKHLVGEEDRAPQAQLKMASIHGAAGMGKTTLARLVYEKIEHKFDARAFVSITSCHNTTEVLESIYQQIVQGLPDIISVLPLAGTKAATAEEHFIDVISSFLEDKRYLVIIDDIWHWGEWETIKKSLPDNNRGSRILTTTRVNTVTDKWHDDFDALVHKIGPRDYEVRFRFFASPDVKDEEVIRIVRRIVEMCEGMPLAVACMVSALAKERERQEQQGLCVGTHALQDGVLKQVTGNGIQKTPGFEPLVESLELGYKDLPHHMLKTCLLYCSIYPEKHNFRRHDLVSRWIVEGFVRKEEAAKDYFDELVSRGFFLNSAPYADAYNVHPMLRNYLKRKLREDNFITCTSDSDVPSSPVGRLCIDYWPSSDAADTVDPLSRIDLHHIRSLVVFEDVQRVPYKCLQRLRVLDAKLYHGTLENQHLKDMCGLLRLRHLFVSGACWETWRITEIPADIAKLQHLETLHVNSTSIERLPAEIGELRQLKTLDVRSNRLLAEIPEKMRNLQNLETLCICRSSITEQAWETIGTLEKLKTLDVSYNHGLSGIPKDIGELQQLKHLDVSNNSGITTVPRDIIKLQHLERLDLSSTGITELPKEIGKLQHLEKLDLSSTKIIELPKEIGNLQRLVYLDLHYTKITKVPQDIVKLQHLESLDFRRTHIRKMPREIWGLQNLKYLRGELRILPLEAGQHSKLEGLPEFVREAWKNSHLVPSLAGEIITGGDDSELKTGGADGLISHTKHMHIPRWIKEHFNNIPSLDIRICEVEEHGLKILQEMPNLQNLTLRFEGVARKPIVISSGGFANLDRFIVDSRVPRVTFEEGAMPMLRVLEFEFQFYGGPPNTDPMGIKHLVSLVHVCFKCNKRYLPDSPCISARIDVVRNEAREHPARDHPNWILMLHVPGKDPETFPENRIITKSSKGPKQRWGRRDNRADISEYGSEACSSSGAQEIEKFSEYGSEACSSSGAQEIEKFSEDGSESCSSSGAQEIDEIQA